MFNVALALSAWERGNLVIKKKSNNDVPTTLDRLEAKLKENGIAVIARVDHAAAAAKVDMELRPTQVLFFGNPKLGTPLMQGSQVVGLELPMRVLAWEDEEGQTWVTYYSPQTIATTHNVGDRVNVINMLTVALDSLTDFAVASA